MPNKELVKLAKQKFKNKNVINNYPDFEDHCLDCFNNCSSQSYGFKIPTKFGKDNNLEELSKSAAQGDFKVIIDSLLEKLPCLKPGDRFEMKTSFLYRDNNKKTKRDSYNFLQIRPHHDFEYYLFLAIDIDYTEDDVNFEWYVLKKSDVNSKNFKMTITHGSEESTKNNETVCYKINVIKNSKHHEKLKELNLLQWKTSLVE